MVSETEREEPWHMGEWGIGERGGEERAGCSLKERVLNRDMQAKQPLLWGIDLFDWRSTPPEPPLVASTTARR